MKILNKKRN